MRVAVIDLGTNTFNLLIAEIISDKHFKKIYSDRIPVKLGEGSINEGFISEAPFQRGIAALIEYKHKIINHNVTLIKAIATSAIRSSSNGKFFTEKIKELTEIDVEIIDGNREAELIFNAATFADKKHSENALIMDIGGGSTEFIIVKDKKLIWKKSYQLGAARLLQQFKPENPISEETKTKLYDFLKHQLDDLLKEISTHQPQVLVGTSGAFDSFVDMLAAKSNNSGIDENQISYEINKEQFKQLYQQIIASTHDERKNIKGLIAMRIDMIVISFILADFVLQNAKLNEFYCCTYSLKEGVLIEQIKEIAGKKN